VLARACQDRQRWQSQGAGEISLSVNVSAHQFMSAGFARSVASVLDSSATRPDLLTLGVTESVFVRDRDRAPIVLDELRASGVKLALDDFGTGYSLLSYLQTLPIDTIKIDRTFVANLSSRPTNRTIVIAIIQLAHGLKMTVVAKGVDTTEQQRQLTKLGSDCCQGPYFARPMPAASIDSLIHIEHGNIRLPLRTTAV
jgi:EAL domain-containing protein (putative c-di-GMP-specific phosphodiesterase class I)